MADPVPVAELVIGVLERLAIRYVIGGSMASSVHGLPRSTNDIDIVAELRPPHVAPLVKALKRDFSIEESAVRDAVARGSSFSVIHMELIEKVDLFVVGNEPWSREQLERRQLAPLLDSTTGRNVFYASPEDTILSKLAWYKLGRGISERQLLDVIDVIQVQGPALDDGYLDHWAENLGVADLLARVRQEADRLLDPDIG